MRIFKYTAQIISLYTLLITGTAYATSMCCSPYGLCEQFSDYFFLEIGNPNEIYKGVSGEVGNYAYTQDFRILQYEKNDFCKDNCHTLILAAPLPYHRANRLTIKPGEGYTKGVYRMEVEYRTKPNDPWQESRVLTCLIPNELEQK